MTKPTGNCVDGMIGMVRAAVGESLLHRDPIVHSALVCRHQSGVLTIAQGGDDPTVLGREGLAALLDEAAAQVRDETLEFEVPTPAKSVLADDCETPTQH